MSDILEIYKERNLVDDGFNSTVDFYMLQIAEVQARGYQINPKGYFKRLLTNDTQRQLSAWVVTTFRHLGILDDCVRQKDFTQWAERQPVPDKWKKVLANMMSIIYSIINEPQPH